MTKFLIVSLIFLLLLPGAVLYFRPSPTVVTVAGHLLLIVILVLLFVPVRKREIKAADLIYNDKHLEIYNDYFVLTGYYFGPFGRRKIEFKEIDKIEVIRFRSSCWRLQGTGDFRTWFAQDLKRYRKKENFIISFTGKRGKVGFSVEDFERVSKIFADKSLLKKK